MKYVNRVLRFSFELPDGWQQQGSVIPPTFVSPHGVIQVNAATIRAGFETPAQRRAFMEEPGFAFLEGPALGDETENVVRLRDISHNEGWLSAVRGEINFVVTWDRDDQAGMQTAIDHLVATFVFPQPKAAQAAVERAQQITPAQKVAHEILFGGPTSIEDVRRIVEEGGMVPIGTGETGTFYGFPDASSKRNAASQRKQPPDLFMKPLWHFAAFFGAVCWGVFHATVASVSNSLLFFAPPALTVILAVLAVERPSLTRITKGAITLYADYLVGLLIGYILSLVF